MKYRSSFLIKIVFIIFLLLLIGFFLIFNTNKHYLLNNLLLESIVQPKVVNTQIPVFDLVIPYNSIKIKSTSYHGKWLLIRFWATWCSICKEELFLLEKFAEYFNKKLQIVLISIDEDWNKVNKLFVYPPSVFELGWDRDSKIAKQFKVSKLPESFLISPEGCILIKFTGFRNWKSKEILKYFHNILD